MNPSTLEQWVGAIVERAASAAAEKVLAGLEERLSTMKPASSGPAYLDVKRLGEKFNVTRRAMVQRLKTRPALMALSRIVEGKRLWIAADVDAYMRGGGK